MPEQLISRAPAVLVNHMLDAWSEDPGAFPAEVRAEYIAKFSAPDTIHAICEQYRAAATLDHQHDEADRGTRRIACPTLALWSHAGAVASWYQPLEVWRTWADEVPSRRGISSRRKPPTRRRAGSSSSSPDLGERVGVEPVILRPCG